MFLYPKISLLVHSAPNLIDIALFFGVYRQSLHVCSGAFFNFCYIVNQLEREAL